ncbi:AraC family transcriptional regulator [Thalassobius sp. MITS945101]|uniref:helix-turn-helix transcriptional regulator n=1 Tax=Thalassobius sp. MITS945101 TaxID=3096994 RepID=UPI00399BE0CA
MDRLSALMERFEMQIEPVEPAAANLLVLGDPDGVPCHVLLRGASRGRCGDRVVFAARVTWGGEANPLMEALPEAVELPLKDSPELIGLITFLQSEIEGRHCGGPTVQRRLGEVLMVRLLRHQISAGSTEPGVLAGLADPRLSRAVVAIHDRPGHGWTNADLAQEAGLSLSRFAELFGATVGMTPMAYLRHWRLTVAHQDLMRGDRVEAVARRYGYGSGEAFARAFKARFGVKPVAVRTQQAA